MFISQGSSQPSGSELHSASGPRRHYAPAQLLLTADIWTFVVQRLNQRRNCGLVTDLPECPRDNRVDLFVFQQRHEYGNCSRILQITKKVSGVVSVSSDLNRQCPIPTVILPYLTVGPVPQNIYYDLKPLSIAESRKYKGRFASHVSILILEVGLKRLENGGVVEFHQSLCYLKLICKGPL